MTRLTIIAAAFIVAVVMGWWIWPEDRRDATIDTLNRIGDADVGEGDPVADDQFNRDWLRQNR